MSCCDGRQRSEDHLFKASVEPCQSQPLTTKCHTWHWSTKRTKHIEDTAPMEPACHLGNESSWARPRAIHEFALVEVFLECLEARIPRQLRIPLWVELDAMRHCPHHPLVARLSCCSRVAEVTWLGATAGAAVVQMALELLEAGSRGQ